MLMTQTQRPVSLRAGLLLRLGIVLVLLLTMDAVASYFTALHYANLVYDRWLIDSTRSLAQAVRAEHGQIEFDLPRVALEIFQFDEVDKTYFKVSSESEGFIGGDAGLPERRPDEHRWAAPHLRQRPWTACPVGLDTDCSRPPGRPRAGIGGGDVGETLDLDS